MCGIAGCFSPTPLPADTPARLQRMAAAIAHRGPDGHGQQQFDHAALVHTRLAIIDLDQGAQPMSDSSGRYWISFNGEIYNYRELREELKRDGAAFQSHSDTEVILNLWQQQGVAGLSRLRGMYAIAIWDQQARQGLLLRDPCGIKPLFIRRRPRGEVCFASEAKALLAWDDQRARLDESALHLLMNFRYLPGDLSLMRGIEQISPGQVLHWRQEPSGHARIRSENLPRNDPGADTDTLATLRESIQLHSVADVPVGAYLSGGVDSAAIVALGETSLPTYTLAVGDDPAEAEQARRSADLFGVSNHLSIVDDSQPPDLHHLLSHLEVPKINALQVGLLAQAARGEVKVALSGLGGDELFLGYNAHRLMHLADLGHRSSPGFLSRTSGNTLALAAAKLSATPWGELERGLRMLASLGDWPRVYGLMRNLWDQPQLRQQIYGPRMLDHVLPDAWSELRQHWAHTAGDETDPVLAMARFENRHKLVNDLLWQEDRMSMAHGLEVRTPFVDLSLRQSLQHWSRARLMPRGQAKAGMRELLASVLPAEILQRPKSGFQVAAGAFFQTHLQAHAAQYLSPEKVREIGLFNPDWVARSLSFPPDKAHRWHYFILYLMLLTHIWLELFEQDTWKQHL